MAATPEYFIRLKIRLLLQMHIIIKRRCPQPICRQSAKNEQNTGGSPNLYQKCHHKSLGIPANTEQIRLMATS